MRRVTTVGFRVRLTLAALGLALGFLIAELAARLYAGLDHGVASVMAQLDPMGVLIAPHGELGYRPRPNSVFRYSNGTVATSNAMGYRGPLGAMPKPAGTFRIVLLGESTTHGWGVTDDETIDAHMRRLLRDRHPGRSIEVINLAFDGYDSRQLLERLRTDGTRLEPDLIIANTGINDVRNARFDDLADPDARTVLWADVLQRLRAEQMSGGPTLWTQIKHRSYLARLPALARRYSTGAWRPREPAVRPNLQAADIFERNLGRIAALASEADIPVVFSTPPSSLPSRYEPRATSDISYWIVDAATTQRFRDELARRMQRVVASELSRGHQAAYVSFHLPPEMFLDDAHLTPGGNRQMASNFLAAVAPYLAARGVGPASVSVTKRDRPMRMRTAG